MGIPYFTYIVQFRNATGKHVIERYTTAAKAILMAELVAIDGRQATILVQKIAETSDTQPSLMG